MVMLRKLGGNDKSKSYIIPEIMVIGDSKESQVEELSKSKKILEKEHLKHNEANKMQMSFESPKFAIANKETRIIYLSQSGIKCGE